jgi:hypothetical protein
MRTRPTIKDICLIQERASRGSKHPWVGTAVAAALSLMLEAVQELRAIRREVERASTD